jgi:cytochrome P450 monooxygenase
MAKQTQDKLDLRSQILTVFMPGRDSTAHALANVLHVLARKPEVYSKLREEVLQYQNEELTFEVLKSMKYMQWVLNEGMRREMFLSTNP